MISHSKTEVLILLVHFHQKGKSDFQGLKLSQHPLLAQRPLCIYGNTCVYLRKKINSHCSFSTIRTGQNELLQSEEVFCQNQTKTFIVDMKTYWIWSVHFWKRVNIQIHLTCNSDSMIITLLQQTTIYQDSSYSIREDVVQNSDTEELVPEKRAGRRELIVSVPGEMGRENRGASLRRNEGGLGRSTCCLSCLQQSHSFFACLELHGRFPHSQTSSRHWWSRDNWNLLWLKEQTKGGTLTGDIFRSMPITLLASPLLSSAVRSHLGCFQDLTKVLQGTLGVRAACSSTGSHIFDDPTQNPHYWLRVLAAMPQNGEHVVLDSGKQIFFQ